MVRAGILEILKMKFLFYFQNNLYYFNLPLYGQTHHGQKPPQTVDLKVGVHVNTKSKYPRY